MSKKSKAPGKCVFCGKTGVTKQHMWPDWIKNVHPRTDKEHTQQITHLDSSSPLVTTIKPFMGYKRGPLGAYKLRIVCAACNNGWMSQLEQKSQPILTNLILNQSSRINSDTQQILAAWVSLMAMVAEYTDVPNMAIPPEHRNHLRQNGYPPEGWKIWLGNNVAPDWSLSYHHIGLASHPAKSPEKSFECNTQFSTIGIGAVIFYVASTVLHSSVLKISDEFEKNMVQIWPTNLENVQFPISPPMDSAKIERLALPAWIFSRMPRTSTTSN